MSDNKYMAFSMQIFLIFLLVIVNTVISTKSLTLRVSTFVLIHPQFMYHLVCSFIVELYFCSIISHF
jgi:hypothetical protein